MSRAPGPARFPDPLRRRLLAAGAGTLLAPGRGHAQAALQAALLRFPRDHGSHPQDQTEWWYITGHSRVPGAGQLREIGFQLTFFRARVAATQGMRSRFAAQQLLFAHAAVADIGAQRFWHDQRIARAGFEVAEAREGDTGLRIRDWMLRREADGSYTARLPAQAFGLALRLHPTQPLLLQGAQGLSRKGPDPRHFSRYYSQPQLAFEGEIRLAEQRIAVRGGGARGPAGAEGATGAAWYDHEWSDGLMPEDAAGWDWIGMNLFDGSALMAFQMRDATGRALWDAGAFRAAPGTAAPTVFAPGATTWTPLRHWTSPLTQARYPVQWQLRTPQGEYRVHALMDAQELDSRASTGAIYWEGLSELRDAAGRPVGRGYLEMTGYAKKLVL